MRRVRRRGRSFVPISPEKERRTRGGEAIPGRRREKKHISQSGGARRAVSVIAESSHTPRLFRYSRIGCAI